MAPKKQPRPPASPLQQGQLAPAFSLPDASGAAVSLADLRGQWVVIYFYPRDNTPGCTREACEFTAQAEAFAQRGARVVGISPDSPASHRRFADKHGLNITLLSDADRTVLRQYGAWGTKTLYGKKHEGVIRSTVLVDPQGRVAWHWAKVSPAGHADEVLAKLAELQGGGP